MTGRGRPMLRGGIDELSTRGLPDTMRRGRGRPRKYPLTSQPQAPINHYQDSVVDGYFEEEEEVEDDYSDGKQMDDAKLKQQQKMMIVNPMGQKFRGKGRQSRRQFMTSRSSLHQLEGLKKDPLVESEEQHPQQKDDKEESGSSPPPPPPKNLSHKLSHRGKSSPVIPPHRRPVPKDLVPPGTAQWKANWKRSKNDDGDEFAESKDIPSTSKEMDKNEVEVKRKREGQDLPFEHMPKQKARHVARAGIMPNVQQYDTIKSFDQPVMIEMEGGNVGDQQDSQIISYDDYAQIEQKAHSQKQYIEFEEDGVNVVYELEATDDIVDGNRDATMIVGDDGREYLIHDGEDGKDADLLESSSENQKEEHRKDEVNTQNDIEEGKRQVAHEFKKGIEDDDLPPQLIPEQVQEDEVVDETESRPQEKKNQLEAEDNDMLNLDFGVIETGQIIQLNSPGGRSHEVQLARDQDGNSIFIDENGVVVELVTDNGQIVEPSNVIDGSIATQEKPRESTQEVGEASQDAQSSNYDLRGVEFNFLDNSNICCGLCGEIVAYETLVSEHLTTVHPEYMQPGVELEEVPYESWLKSRLKQEVKNMENGFRNYDDGSTSNYNSVRLFSRGLRQMRRVSQIRVNPHEMSLVQLEMALRRKIVEKLGRKVPVSLVDRFHARCDVCQAVVSLNKKFEVTHLARHFNAWHPAEHRCAGSWRTRVSQTPGLKTLSLHDFAVVDTESDQNNLQCIWCGSFMDRAAIGMHFTEAHVDQVEVPKCSLCLQEMVLTARLAEKFGEDFEISLPDEFHVHSNRLNNKYTSEKSLEKGIAKYLKRVRSGQPVDQIDEENEDDDDEEGPLNTTNSQQMFGKRNRMKRKFVKPCYRQICPTNSQYFEAHSACEWKCKLCQRNVYGAVISAGAIRHFKVYHPEETEKMQYELVRARLERIGDGSMEFVHPQLVECLICNLSYSLHKPYNICRAIRHLRIKHPEVMPETSGKVISGANVETSRTESTSVDRTSTGGTTIGTSKKKKMLKHGDLRLGELIRDPIKLEKFRREHNIEFDRVQVVYTGKNNDNPSYVLLNENEEFDDKVVQALSQDLIEKPDLKEVKKEPVTSIDEEPTTSSAVPNNYSVDQVVVMEEPEYEMNQPDQQIMEDQLINMVNNKDFSIDFNEDTQVIQMEDGNYQIIDQSYDDSNRLQYMTEEELQEAQERGELQIEYIDQPEMLEFGEYEAN